MKLSTGLRSTALSSASISQAKEAIADRFFLYPKSGRKTPWNKLISGLVVQESTSAEWKSWASVSFLDIDNHECMTLGSIQTRDCKTLDNMGKNLVDWYSSLSLIQ